MSLFNTLEGLATAAIKKKLAGGEDNEVEEEEGEEEEEEESMSFHNLSIFRNRFLLCDLRNQVIGSF